jgi:16S rRNA (guanine527-N7)-methyltransferase
MTDRQTRENRKVAVPRTPRRRERSAGTKTEHTARHEAASGPPSLPRASPQRVPLPSEADRLPPPSAELWRIVDAGLAGLELELTRPMRDALDAQLRLMLAWSEHVNLTALRTPEQIARGHLLDSLSGVGLLRRLAHEGVATSGRLRLLDLGSGAGYPGLPLAVVVPAGRCALVDSVGKKARFLELAGKAAAAAMRAHDVEAPSMEALPERAEDLAEEADHRQGWDIVTARAVGTLAEVAELGLPLARIGGFVVAWKREPQEAGLRDEINDARRVINAAGGEHPFVVAPDREGRAGLAEHRLVVIRKVRATPDRYPRPPAERKRPALR